MFVDLVVKFCCSKRQRPDQDNPPQRGPREGEESDQKISPHQS